MALSTFAKMGLGAPGAAQALAPITQYFAGLSIEEKREERKKIREEAERMRKQGVAEEVIKKYRQTKEAALKKPAAAEVEEPVEGEELLTPDVTEDLGAEALGVKVPKKPEKEEPKVAPKKAAKPAEIPEIEGPAPLTAEEEASLEAYRLGEQPVPFGPSAELTKAQTAGLAAGTETENIMRDVKLKAAEAGIDFTEARIESINQDIKELLNVRKLKPALVQSQIFKNLQEGKYFGAIGAGMGKEDVLMKAIKTTIDDAKAQITAGLPAEEEAAKQDEIDALRWALNYYASGKTADVVIKQFSDPKTINRLGIDATSAQKVIQLFRTTRGGPTEGASINRATVNQIIGLLGESTDPSVKKAVELLRATAAAGAVEGAAPDSAAAGTVEESVFEGLD